MKDLPKKKSLTKITQNEKQELQSWALTCTRAVSQRTLRQETTMAEMGTLPHYSYTQDTQDTHENTRNTVPYDNESSKRVANCEHLNDASISQNDEESNNDQCNLKETDKFSEENDVEEGNNGLMDIDHARLFLVGRASRFERAVKINNRFLE